MRYWLIALFLVISGICLGIVIDQDNSYLQHLQDHSKCVPVVDSHARPY